MMCSSPGGSVSDSEWIVLEELVQILKSPEEDLSVEMNVSSSKVIASLNPVDYRSALNYRNAS